MERSLNLSTVTGCQPPAEPRASALQAAFSRLLKNSIELKAATAPFKQKMSKMQISSAVVQPGW